MVTDQQRMAVVCTVFRLLERGELPGPDLVHERARIAPAEALFVTVGDEGDLFTDRWRKLLAAAPEHRVVLREVYAAPNQRVLAIATAIRPGSAEAVAFLYDFDGARIRSGRLTYDVETAFAALGLDHLTADRAAARLVCPPLTPA